jgi:ADP-ribosylglycohydrolase
MYYSPEMLLRLQRAQLSLDGLAVGDAFGTQFFSFSSSRYHTYFEDRRLPETRELWRFTDDTLMALSLVDILAHDGQIHQDHLMESFAAHYDPSRGYGASMHTLLREVRAGKQHWSALTKKQFEGQGSYGNGAAMRVAPLGAFFAHDMETLCVQARFSAEVTHTHSEAVAGAIAIAVAAALA